MKHKLTVEVETTKKGLFGKKKVVEKKEIVVDGKTYRKIKKDKKTYSIEEQMFYESIFDDD